MKLRMKKTANVLLEKGAVELEAGDVVEVDDDFGKHLLKTNRDFEEVEKKSTKSKSTKKKKEKGDEE